MVGRDPEPTRWQIINPLHTMEIIFFVFAIFTIGLVVISMSRGKSRKSGRGNIGGPYPMDSHHHHHQDGGDHNWSDGGGWDGGGGGGDSCGGGGDGGGGGD